MRASVGYRLLLVGVGAVLLSGACGRGDSPGVPRPADTSGVAAAPVPTVLVVDGSGSMNTADAPGPRIDAAKTAATSLVEGLPDDAELGLMTYGTSTGSAPQDKAAGCRDVRTLVPLGSLDRDRVRSAIAGIVASGYTPLSLALQQAVQQLPADDSAQAVVLVSDGQGTCDVDPCETARQLKAQRPGLTISTVGFRLDGVAAEQLSCIARVSGGLFVTAENTEQLTARLLATRDLGQAKGALTGSGLAGIDLGQHIDDIRRAHPDFPSASSTGVVTVVWTDCEWTFTDGTLTQIAPRDGGRTIDGVGPDTPLSRATELYGKPVKVETDGHGGYRVTYSADPGTDNGYRILVEDYADSGGTISGTVKTIVLCRCAPHPVSLPDVPPPVSGCPADVIAHRDIDHKTLGTMRLFLLLDTQHRLDPPGCVVAVAGDNKVLPAIPIDAYPDELAFADPVTDATGNAFITYNPGRYNGVLVLVPTAGGFEDIGWDDPKYGTHYSGKRAYYNAELAGPGPDGRYTIPKFIRHCPPGCQGSADEITTSQDLHWNGSDYVP